MKISGNDGLVDGLGRVILQPMPDGDVADVERESHTIPERLQRLLTACSAGLVERDEETQLLLLAAVAGEHVLLIGPPGTAKSELARRLGLAFEGGPFFERLLTRFTVPEELFGPLSIKRLEQDEYHRLTDGYLPAASVAFLDEIFKANSAILNALLTLLNERCFDNGRERIRVPLVCVVGASNELPESSDLGALFDRFLVRCFVEPVSSEAFDALLTASSEWEPPSPRDRLSLAELDAVRRESRAVEVPPEVRMFLRALRDLLREEGFEVSDRRWRKLLDLLRVAAAADGRARVALADCGLARWCIWSEPPQLSRMTELLTKALDVVHLHEVSRIDDVSSVLLAKVDEEAAAEEQVTDESGQLLWRDENGREGPRRPQAQAVTTTGDPLYVAPAEMERDGTRVAYTFAELWERHYSELPHGYRRLEEWTANPAHQVMTEAPMAPVVRPRRFSREHVESRRAQLEAVQSDVAIFLEMFEPEAEQPSLWPRLEVSDLGKAIADAQARLARVARGVARALEQVAALEVHDP